MPGEKHGEVIDLFWDCYCGPPGFFAIRGHVDLDQAAETIRQWMDDQGYEREEFESYEPPQHAYARWCQTAHSRAEGRPAEMRTYSDPGRGKFPITLMELGGKR